MELERKVTKEEGGVQTIIIPKTTTDQSRFALGVKKNRDILQRLRERNKKSPEEQLQEQERTSEWNEISLGYGYIQKERERWKRRGMAVLRLKHYYDTKVASGGFSSIYYVIKRGLLMNYARRKKLI